MVQSSSAHSKDRFLGRFFVTSLILFLFNTSAITVFIAQSYKNQSTDTLYITLSAVILLLKSYISTYSNSTDSIKQNRYYILIINSLVFISQTVCFFIALYSFTNDTYPKLPYGFLFITSVILFVQILIGRLKKVAKFQLLPIVIYGILYGVLHQPFNPTIFDPRVLLFFSITTTSTELLTLLTLYRQFHSENLQVTKGE